MNKKEKRYAVKIKGTECEQKRGKHYYEIKKDSISISKQKKKIRTIEGIIVSLLKLHHHA
jgi:hypothetical protein